MLSLPDDVSRTSSVNDISLPRIVGTPTSSQARDTSMPEADELASSSIYTYRSLLPAQVPLPESPRSSQTSIAPDDIALPASPYSSVRSVSPEEVALNLHPEPFDHPSIPDNRRRHQPSRREFVQRRASARADRTREDSSISNEVDDYRALRQRVADRSKHFPDLGTETTRSDPNRETTPTVYFDYHDDSSLDGPNWLGRETPLAVDTLRDLPDAKLKLRCVLLEDLEPMKIDIVGAALRLDIRFFGTHLSDSGYAHSGEQSTKTHTWSTFQSTGQHCSIKWIRPIMPSLVVNGRLRDRLLSGRTARAPCVRKCEAGRHEVNTKQNIFRRALELSADQDSADSTFPMGWE